MIVTTANDETAAQAGKARELALKYGLTYTPRRKRPIKTLLELDAQGLFVVNGARGLSYYNPHGQEVFFHPNMAFHRVSQLRSGQKDSLVSACGLEAGMSFFDGTLGLASDSLVAAAAVGPEGLVVSAEKSLPLGILVEEGLKTYGQSHPEWASLTKALNVKRMDNLQLLSKQTDGSFDVVYFDFMFSKTLDASSGIQVIKPIAAADVLSQAHIAQALRVARKRVVVKARAASELEAQGFRVSKSNRRRHFCYGVMEIDKRRENHD